MRLWVSLCLILAAQIAPAIEIVAHLTPELRAACAKHNLKIMLKAGKDDEAEYRAIVAASPDYANIDFPALFKKVLAEK